MKHLVTIISFISLLCGLFLGCDNTNNCFEKYPREIQSRFSTLINVDSVIQSKYGCFYIVNLFLFFPDESMATQGILTLEKDKFKLKLTRPESNEFILFDMGMPQFSSRKIEIEHDNTTDVFLCIYENKIITRENLEVRIFRIKDCACFDSHWLDEIFFMTREYGIIGSYFTDSRYFEKIMISPAGDILRDYIDYSGVKLKRIL